MTTHTLFFPIPNVNRKVLSKFSDSVLSLVGSMSAEYHVLPGCDGCMVLSGNSSVKDLGQYFRFMNYESSIKTDKEVNARVFYLMGRKKQVTQRK